MVVWYPVLCTIAKCHPFPERNLGGGMNLRYYLSQLFHLHFKKFETKKHGRVTLPRSSKSTGVANCSSGPLPQNCSRSLQYIPLISGTKGLPRESVKYVKALLLEIQIQKGQSELHFK